MPLVALSELRARAREHADMENSKFVSDATLRRWLNVHLQRLYDLLVQANQDYAVTTQNMTVGSGANTIALPSTFYKLRGVDIDFAGTWMPVKAFDFLERGRFQDSNYSRLYATVRYRIEGNTLELLPAADAPGTYRLKFVPYFAVLVNDSDTFDGINGFEEYAALGAAIYCKAREESSTKELSELKAELERQLLAMANTRDQGEPQRIVDVRSAYG